MASWSTTTKKSSSTTKSQAQSQSESKTQRVLDEALLETILGGLTGQMTQKEIEAFARNLLTPALNAGIEAAQMQHETTKLAKEQEIANLASSLAQSIGAQERAYRQSMADVETAAIERGMGRSSYTLERLAGEGDALARAVRALTQENEKKTAQIQAQITQSAQQSERTKARLNEDYAKQLAAKMTELTQAQRREQSSNYLTAVSAAMGSRTQGTSETNSTSSTDSTSVTTSTSGKTGGGSSAGTAAKKKEKTAAGTLYSKTKAAVR